MLVKSVHAAKAAYDNNHVKLIPNRPINYRYYSNGQPYDISSGLTYGFGAAKFYGGWDTLYTASNATFPSQYAGGIAVGSENYYVSHLIGGYNGMPSTWTILQRVHDTANWKYCHAIVEVSTIYFDSQNYARYLITGYSTPGITTLETAGASPLGLQVANATQIDGNFYRYDIQMTGLGNYRIAYFTLRTTQSIVGHPLTYTQYDTWRTLY
jgi:hypothetical protein